MQTKIIDFLFNFLRKHLEKATLKHLIGVKEKICATADKNIFFLHFSTCVRFLPKEACVWEDSEIASATTLVHGWMPKYWTLQEISRAYLLLNLPHENEVHYAKTLDELFQTADLGESVAISKAVVLLPYPKKHLYRSTLALRSNTKMLFEAIAHHNPYPALHLDENAWNHLILKAIFIGSTLDPIQGIDLRANVALKNMLIDFAKECQSAGRKVSPELWHCVSSQIEKQDIDFLQAIYQDPQRQDALAVGLALSQSSCSSQINNILSTRPTLYQLIKAQTVTWNNILSTKLA